MSWRSPRRPIRRGLPHLVDFGWRERLTRTHVVMVWRLGKVSSGTRGSSLRNFPVFEAWSLRTQRAHREQRRRPCYQTFLKKPLFRNVSVRQSPGAGRDTLCATPPGHDRPSAHPAAWRMPPVRPVPPGTDTSRDQVVLGGRTQSALHTVWSGPSACPCWERDAWGPCVDVASARRRPHPARSMYHNV